MTTTTVPGVPKVYAWPRDGGPPLDLSPYVIGLEVQSTLDPPWSFTVQLAADASRAGALARLASRIRPQALLSIGVDRPGGLCLGLASGLQQSHQFAGPAYRYTVQLAGFDLVGKALTRDNVVHALLNRGETPEFFDAMELVFGPDHPLLAALQSTFGPGQPVGSFEGRTVQELVAWIVEQIPSMRFPILADTLGGDGRIGSVVDTSRSVTTWNDDRIWSKAPQTFEGNLLGYLRSIVDDLFYEVFTSYVPAEDGGEIPVPLLVVRPRPFDDSASAVLPVEEETGITWNDLRCLVTGEPYHTIPRSSIHRLDTATSDAEAIGYYNVSSAVELVGSDAAAAIGYKYPVVDTYVASVFGIRSLEARLILASADITEAVDNNAPYTSELTGRVRQFRDRLVNWHRYNLWHESGTLQVHGRDDYRPGDKVYLPDHQHTFGTVPGMWAYVEGVRWAWSLGGPYTATIRFSRGQSPEVLDTARQTIADDAARYGTNPDHLAVV